MERLQRLKLLRHNLSSPLLSLITDDHDDDDDVSAVYASSLLLDLHQCIVFGIIGPFYSFFSFPFMSVFEKILFQYLHCVPGLPPHSANSLITF